MSNNPGYTFENELLNALRDAFPHTFSHRFKQSRRTGQPFDLAVWPPHACMIECKSRDVRGRNTLKLESLFREGQLEDEIERANRFDLFALLALELRYGRGRSKEAFYMPLSDVSGETIDLGDPNMIEIPRVNGKYEIPEYFPDVVEWY